MSSPALRRAASADFSASGMRRTASAEQERLRSQLSRLSAAEAQQLMHAERKAILSGGPSAFDRWAADDQPALQTVASAPPQYDAAAGEGAGGEQQPHLAAVGKCASAAV